VPLQVDIEPVDAGNTACGICSDVGDPYVNGQEGIRAQFDQYGNLTVDFGARSVDFSFGNPDLASGLHADSYLATRFSGGFLQDLGDGASACAEMNWIFRDGAVEYRLLFHRTGYPSPIDVAATAYAFVTRIDADTWTVEPRGAADCGVGDDRLAGVVSLPTKGRVVYTDHGDESMPFRLTLTRQ